MAGAAPRRTSLRCACLHRSARGGREELAGVRDRSAHPSDRSWPARPVRARPFRRDLPHPSNALGALVLCACRSGWNALDDRSDRPRRRLCAAPGPSAAPRAAAAAPGPLPRSPRAAPVLRTAPGRAAQGAQTGAGTAVGAAGAAREGGSRWRCSLPTPARPARPPPARARAAHRCRARCCPFPHCKRHRHRWRGRAIDLRVGRRPPGRPRCCAGAPSYPPPPPPTPRRPARPPGAARERRT